MTPNPSSTLLRLARKEWRRADRTEDDGASARQMQYQSGRVKGCIEAYAVVSGLTFDQAKNHVRSAARMALAVAPHKFDR
jgi:hypothetical protein